jgi:hypothetical protein
MLSRGCALTRWAAVLATTTVLTGCGAASIATPAPLPSVQPAGLTGPSAIGDLCRRR